MLNRPTYESKHMKPQSAREEALLVLNEYLAGTSEHASLAALFAQLASSENEIFQRSNSLGHITTSTLVVDFPTQMCMLIHHNEYQRWLPPGGHYEEGAPLAPSIGGTPSWLWASALREVAEETGLEHVSIRCSSTGLVIPLDIDTHSISANSKKAELAHVHHDFLYLAESSSSERLRPQLDEVSAAKWVPISYLQSLDVRLQRIHKKLTGLAS